MKKVVLVVVVAIVFAACGNHHRAKTVEPLMDSIQSTKADSVVKKPVEETMERKFYSEFFNKQGLVLGKWRDSTEIAQRGEGGDEYTLPIKVQNGSTESFVFRITTTNEYWEENGWEDQSFGIYYKLIGTPIEGKTLAEDAKNRERYEWNYLTPQLGDSIKVFLSDIQYPKKKYIHKK
ncbi:MAG: hypothetical protein WCO66_02300 [Candidatus Absconditabacteria bacterium]